jgi:hypothetical protein
MFGYSASFIALFWATGVLLRIFENWWLVSCFWALFVVYVASCCFWAEMMFYFLHKMKFFVLERLNVLPSSLLFRVVFSQYLWTISCKMSYLVFFYCFLMWSVCETKQSLRFQSYCWVFLSFSSVLFLCHTFISGSGFYVSVLPEFLSHFSLEKFSFLSMLRFISLLTV